MVSEQSKRNKRGQNEGGCYQRKDGRWEATITLEIVNGKPRRKSYYGKTKAAAMAAMRAGQRERDAGLPIDVPRQTVGQFLDRWLADVVKTSLAPKTYSSYAETARVHINPTLGHHQLAKLSPQQVQELLAVKTAAGLSARTVSYIRTVLRIALAQAVRWGLIGRNAAALASPPRILRQERRPLSPEQARYFLDAVAGDRLEALYRVAVSLGLRQGEALGLAWEDVDLDGRTLRVRRALQRIDGKLTLKEPKTEQSRRTLTLPAALVPALTAHRARQNLERLAAGGAWVDNGLVFTTPRGTPLEPSNVLKRFKAILDGAGLPRQRFHDLRHCAASLMLAQGVPMRVVMDILGHTQMATTADLYSHVMPAAHREVADLMDAILTNVPPSRSATNSPG